jgi:anti-sigma regulatory factor (Ser/Thr protein kinase)
VDGASVGDASIVLPSEEGSVGLGRKWLVSALGIAHPAVDDSLQALSEVLTNAITYGVGRDVHICCRQIDGYLEIAVINEVSPGGVRPQKQLLGEMAEHGRGLVLVDAYSESWGVVEMAASRRVMVWFRVRSA